MNWERDKTLIVLCSGMVFFAGLVMLVTYTRSEDVQLYGLFAGVFGQFSGALMMYLKAEKMPPSTQVEAQSVRNLTVESGGTASVGAPAHE
jgi:uncharacterized membrane-anchored protein